jgi:hypothetical protein
LRLHSFKGGTEAYTELWTRRLNEARAAGIEVGVIAVLHQASLDAGPERFIAISRRNSGSTKPPKLAA